MAEVVLDASPLLAFLQREPGLDRVRQALPEAIVGSVNFAEVVTKLVQWGAPADQVAERLDDLISPSLRSIATSPSAPVRCMPRPGGLASPWATARAWLSPAPEPHRC